MTNALGGGFLLATHIPLCRVFLPSESSLIVAYFLRQVSNLLGQLLLSRYKPPCLCVQTFSFLETSITGCGAFVKLLVTPTPQRGEI